MNNPWGSDPAHELLWRMLHEVCGATRVEYRDGFERRNLCCGEWSVSKAMEGARQLTTELLSTPGGRMPTVVALGREVARALDLPEEHGPIAPLVRDGVVWRQVPHPSGRNHWYDEPAHRMAVGVLLEELLHG